MIFVVSALTSAKVREIVNELDCCDPFHHFEPSSFSQRNRNGAPCSTLMGAPFIS